VSNLSDLIPAGASGKTIEAVATATIASKAPVILNSAGTVTEVELTTDAAGTPVVYQANGTTWNQATFDSSNNKVVVSYNVGGTGALVAVGTVSGTAISYGTPVAISGAGNSYGAITYDSSNNKVVIAYRDYSNSDYGTAVVGTVSGTSISFGTPVVFESANSPHIAITFDTNNNAVAIAYSDVGNSEYGTAVVGTVSGTAISFGIPVVFESGVAKGISAVFDTSYNRVVIAYYDEGDSNNGKVNMGSVSGSAILFGGSPTTFAPAATSRISAAYDSNLEKVVIAYQDEGNSAYGTAIVGTATGSYTMTFGTEVVFEAAETNYITATFDSNANKVVIAYQDVANSSYGTVIVGTVSGTTISFDTPVIFETATTTYTGSVYDSNAAKVAIVYSDGGNSDYGTGVVFSVGGTNLTATNFVGIADAGISTSATGTIVVQGGTVTELGNASSAMSFGSPVNFDGAGWKQKNEVTYDTANNRVVNIYEDNTGTGYITAVVGTVSGTTTTWGTAVVVKSATTSGVSIAYDANAQKVVAYYNSSNVNYASVGTVSGTSISFGTEVTVVAANASRCAIAYDANAQKVVVTVDESSVLKALVGTISGTDISFGSAATFYSGAAGDKWPQIAYDANAQKVAIQYTKSSDSYGYAIVGTISGTSISFGAEAAYYSATSKNNDICYDSSAQKLFLSYMDSSVICTGIVGTISGTSISFGSATAVNAIAQSGDIGKCVYDPDNSTIIMAFPVGSTGLVAAGTISGTAVSFGSSYQFNAFGTSEIGLTYDTTADKAVVVYGYYDGGGISPAVVISTATPFVTGSSYYVQNDGTFGTSASTPSVKAGLAISTTSLLLNGDS